METLNKPENEIIADLFEQIRVLRVRLEEKDEEIKEVQKKCNKRIERVEKQVADRGCQTDLCNSGMNKLFEASLELIREKEKRLKQHNDTIRNNQRSVPNHINNIDKLSDTIAMHSLPPFPQSHSTPHAPRQNGKTQHQVMTQLNYPNVSLKKPNIGPSPTNNQLNPDEKVILENLYTLAGHMTTAHHKLKAKTLNSRINS